MAWVRRAGILLTVLVLAIGLSGAVAGAKKKHKKKGESWESEVTLAHPSSTQFTGVVGSKLGACRGDRVVTLTYTDPNTGQTSPLAVQRTDGGGQYQMTLAAPAYAGIYRVLLSERNIRALKAPQFCKAAQSDTVPV